MRHLTCLLLVLLLAGCHWHGQTDSVTVTGSSEIQAIPDVFRVDASIDAEGKDIKALSQQVNNRFNRLQTLAQQLHIDHKQVDALSLQITPEWQWQPKRQLLGYRVSRPVTITIHGLGDYAALLQGMVNIGIDNIGQTRAELSDQKQLMLTALGNAVDNARQKAAQLARAAGRKLGRAREISEQGGYSPRPLVMSAMVKSGGNNNSFNPGQVTIRQQVQVRFSLR